LQSLSAKFFGFPLESTLSRYLITHFQFKDVSNKKNQKLRAFLIQQGSTNNKVQFVLQYTKGGGSSTESLINYLKSKHRIHAILESEDHKTIPAQEEIYHKL